MEQNKTIKDLDDILSPAAVNISSSYIQLGDKYIRTFFVATYPRFLHTNWFSPIINLEKAFDISLMINPKDTSVILKQLRDKLARLQAEITEEEASGKVRNPILETAISDIEDLLVCYARVLMKNSHNCTSGVPNV